MGALDLRSRLRLGLSPSGHRGAPEQVPFNPTQLSGLSFWYDAAESPRTVTDGAVERWDDLSGNQNHAGQSGAAARPLPAMDAADRPVVRFDGTGDVLLVNQPPSLASGVTLFVVFRMRTRADFTGIVAAGAAAGADHEQFFVLQNADAASQQIQVYGRSGQVDPVLIKRPDSGEPQYAIVTIGADAAWVRDVSGEATDPTTTTTFGTPAAIGLGARLNDGAPFAFGAVDLYEVGLFQRVLDAAELDQLEGFLQARHGLLWSPLQFGADLAWLHDADASPVLESDGLVDRWDDRTSHARHFVQTGSSRPSLTNDLDGRNVLRFDGVDDVMAMAGALPALDPFTVALVYRLREPGDFEGLLSAAPASGMDVVDFWSLRTAAAGSGTIELAGRQDETDPLLISRPDTGQPQIVIWTESIGSAALTDGVTQVTDTYGGGFGVPDEIVLGGRYDGAPAGHAALDAYATLGVARVLSTDEQARLIQWAQRRWGI